MLQEGYIFFAVFKSANNQSKINQWQQKTRSAGENLFPAVP
jgi:hypothetical protein